MNTTIHEAERVEAQPLPCADALEMLARRHDQTCALAEECRRIARCVSSGHDLHGIVEALCRALHGLAELEEQSLYPAARGALADCAAVELAELEHATARQIVRQMQLADPREARYEALVVALADCVERHARHEQSELFPKVRASCVDLADLGARLSREETAAPH